MKSIDDRHIDGNPYDSTQWMVEPRGDRWCVFDGLGNQIHEATSEAAARAWVEETKQGKAG